MSCGFTKLATKRNGRSAAGSPARRRAYRSSSHASRAGGGERVAPQPAVGPVPAVRFGADPVGEAVAVERVGVEVGLHRGVVDGAGVVVGGERPARVGVVQVGVREVPLAVVRGVVAGAPEPVAERRHLAGAEPAHGRVVGVLAEAVGLGDAVHVGVLAGEQRRPAGDAGERPGVVPGERDAVIGEPAPARQRPLAPGPQRGVLVRRSGALLVGEDDDDVGRCVAGRHRISRGGRGGTGLRPARSGRRAPGPGCRGRCAAP